MTRTTLTSNVGSPPSKEYTLTTIANIDTLIDMVNEHAAALDTAGVPPGTLGAETVTSGACSLTHQLSYLSTTNTVAYSLADGTVAGQVKQIECSAVSGTPIGTLTVATMDTAGGGASATFVFHAAGQRIELEWSGTAWHLTKVVRAGRKAVVVGTTVLTGYVLAAAYDLSVTATVHSTTTKGIPAGRMPGERIHIDCTTAASSPIGDIAITAKTTAGAAATSLANLTDTTMSLDLTWDAAAWQATQFTAGSGTATLS